jgi:imidazolonepropionase-like amidohydrolase
MVHRSVRSGRRALAVAMLAASVRAAAALVLVAPRLAPPARASSRPAELPTHPGARPERVHALTHAHIVLAPGTTIADGTIVLRDGIIVAVGESSRVQIPPDARVWDGAGRWIYAGLIEPHLRMSAPAAGAAAPAPASPPAVPPAAGAAATARRGAGHWSPLVHPEASMAEHLSLSAEFLRELRAAGFTAGLAVPASGIFRGSSAFVTLADARPNEQVVVPDVAAHLAFERASEESGLYPSSLMGAIALMRQTFLDAAHARAVAAAGDRRPPGERPETDRALTSLAPVLDRTQPVAFEAENLAMLLRAARLAREFKLRGWVVTGAADEYKRVAAVQTSGLGLVTALNFPAPPEWENEDEAVGIELARLRHWNFAPSNPARLHAAGVRFSFTAAGLKRRAEWRERVRAAIARGLPADVALAAVTTEPAALLGVADRLGTIARGKIANLTVTDGELFAAETNILEVWVDGDRYEPAPRLPSAKDVTGEWRFTLAHESGSSWTARIAFHEERGVLVGDLRTGARPDSTRLSRVELRRDRLEFTLPGSVIGGSHEFAVQGTLAGMKAFAGRWAAGDMVPYSGPSTPAGGSPARGEKIAEEKPASPPRAAPIAALIAAESEPYPPPPEPARPSVLVRNATIWTCGAAGTLAGADLLLRDGQVAAVGPGLTPPAGTTLVIDGTGKHVTPGIIDEHSHSAIAGDVNEGTRSSSAEVRIADVIDAESIHIYRQLAGGVTMSHQFHGSANTIGGQDAVIKLRWGAMADELLVAGAPPGIKFALGENVKQSNWGDKYTTRYPQTRMGVEQWARGRFLAARDYSRDRDEWTRKKQGPPPRRDLELEALAEVLRGERRVYCHAYRQDEMLMLMRLADELGFRLATFEHALEGYKVADEMAAHGVGGSSFSDWWAYKFEVYDAIPHNGAIMLDRGVLVAFNSDSPELARRLNSEAAKAVKYGGVPEAEALKFVTLNAARMMGLAARVGSLEPGKDGDFVIWNAPPLSNLARCEETWIEGQRYFSRERDLAARAAAEAERIALLAAARAARAELEAARRETDWQPTFGAFYATGAGDDESQGEE